MNNRPIGIFDSGIGGLTVARAVYDLLPFDSTVYLGDSARVPYGPKSAATVRRYSLEILRWLSQQDVKAIVVACNTATAHALTTIAEATDVPVTGVIKPGARAAALVTRNGKVGVIGTAGTIASGAYREALLAEDIGLEVIEQACPLFVPLVEEGWLSHPASRLIAEEYLERLSAAGVDTVVLGCTHYPLLAPLLGDVLGSEVTLIDSAREAARDVSAVLETNKLGAASSAEPTHRWATTDDPERFSRLGKLFTGWDVEPVELVELDSGSAEFKE